ncbi:Z1 domain-containing protein [Kribbella sp. NPDC051770]|uniref:Z1 domain-containing protein n=1 Tax=Kribbella sp. NPDC051770 TaxID=3155413 RepID=UPI00344596D9
MTEVDNGTSPGWATPLRNLLQGFAEQTPGPLLPVLTMFGGGEVSEEELLAFVRVASVNNNAMIALRLAFSKWDAREDLDSPGLDGVPTAPSTIARRRAVVHQLGLSPAAEEVIRAVIPVHQKKSIIISKEFEPWYEEARHQRSSLYWDDYEKYLAEIKRWPASSITTLDQSTNSVIERLSDPTRAEIKQTKGLVVGYVQSGKTANFTGVIAKAVDAGYRLVIVMTGTIEILRAQTQRRIDMELMGVENVLSGQDPADPVVAKGLDYQQDEEWLHDKFVRHSEPALNQPGVARIRRVTTHHNDYKSLPQGMSQLRYERHDKTKPLNAAENLFHADAYVVIVKKNSAPLTKLIKDLKPLQAMLAELPALIIDDESDLASVNTKDPKKSTARTTINHHITDLMRIVPRAQYVGYTATPFANVFIDPDDDSNLFPSDFVLSLPRPEDYMGVQEFHDVDPDWENVPKTAVTSNEVAFARSIKANPNHDPDLHREELRDAIDSWVLSGAMKKYRSSVSGRLYRHHTMLVHEELGNKAHLDSATVVRSLWDSGRFTSGEGLTRLRKLFDDDFLPVMLGRADGEPVPSSFDDIRPYVGQAVAEMTSGGSDPVLIVNSDKAVQEQQQALDFDAGRVWRILIGGAKLSRGFTVEGLTTTFFRRKAGQADTLMQAGRWFGFREGYSDLVRLYIRRDELADLYEAFEALLLDEEAFRAELAQYAGLDEEGKPLVEPRHIPPLVSQHLPWLKPTARNKMFNAVVKSRGSVGTFHQLSSIPPRGADEHHANLTDVILPLLQRATRDAELPYVDTDKTPKTQSAKVGLIDAAEFEEYFEKLVWHPDYDGVIGPLRAFISTATKSGAIKDWAIMWPQRKRETAGRMLSFPELAAAAPIWKRKRRQPPRIDFTGENKRNLLSAEAVPQGGNFAMLGASSTRGVLVISLVADQNETSELTPVDRPQVVGLISLRVPDASVRNKRELIQYSVVVADKADEIAVDESEAKQ